MRPFDYITKEALNCYGFTIAEKALFHYFNPNGAYAKLQAAQEGINRWIDEHPERPNGAYLAYGFGNDFPRETLRKAVDKAMKRRLDRIALKVAIETVERAAEKANQFVADETRWPAPKPQE